MTLQGFCGQMVLVEEMTTYTTVGGAALPLELISTLVTVRLLGSVRL